MASNPNGHPAPKTPNRIKLLTIKLPCAKINAFLSARACVLSVIRHSLNEEKNQIKTFRVAVSGARLFNGNSGRQRFACFAVRVKGRKFHKLFKRAVCRNLGNVRNGTYAAGYGRSLVAVRAACHSHSYPDGRARVYELRFLNLFNVPPQNGSLRAQGAYVRGGQ